MTDNRSYPLGDARYGVAMTASLGMFDTAGWTPPAADQYALFDGAGRREDYGPMGCAGIVIGATVGLVLLVGFFIVLASLIGAA